MSSKFEAGVQTLSNSYLAFVAAQKLTRLTFKDDALENERIIREAQQSANDVEMLRSICTEADFVAMDSEATRRTHLVLTGTGEMGGPNG